MKSAICFFLCLFGISNAQIDSGYQTVDLKLGASGDPGIMLVPLPRIGSAVVFQRLPHTASCPATRPGDFALKKLNPSAQGFATIEHISNICTVIDSIGINTEFVYEIHTPLKEVFYMRLVDIVEGKVRLWITKNQPPVSLQKKTSWKMSAFQQRFQVNGREIIEGEKPKATVKTFPPQR